MKKNVLFQLPKFIIATAAFLIIPFIVSAQIDVGVIELVSPANCDMGTNQATVTVSVKNFSPTAVSNFPISFSKNSGTPVTETITASIPAGGTYLYSFATKTNINAGGNFNYTITVSHPQDISSANDVLQQQVFIMKKPNLGQNQPLCKGDVLYLYGGTLYDTWTWSTGATTQSININSATMPIGTYTYSITVTATSCVSTDTIIVSVVNNAEVDLGSDITIKMFGHAGISFPIDAGAGFSSYAWSNGMTTQVINVDNSLGIGEHEIDVMVTDNNDCIGRDTVLVRVIDDTGLDELENALSVDVYPNPGNGLFAVSVPGAKGDFQLCVIDATGRKVHEYTGSAYSGLQHMLDISNLSAGAYIIEVVAENGYGRKTLIIRK